MGVDYIARKRKKKHAKQLRRGDRAAKKEEDVVDFEDKGVDGKQKRVRDKKNKVRRLCRGMCYGTPQFEDEDKVWRPEDAFGIVGEKGFDFPKTNIPLKELFSAPGQPKTEGGAPGDGRKQAAKKRKASAASGSEDDASEGEREKPASKKVKKEGCDAAPAKQSAGKAKAAPSPAAKSKVKNVAPAVQRYLTAEAVLEPTPLQRAAWKIMAERPDRSLILAASPGAGSTLACLAGTISRVVTEAPPEFGSGPSILIVTPSPEETRRTLAHVRGMARAAGLKAGGFHSGLDSEELLEKLQGSEAQPNVAVGTMDRLAELLRGGALKGGSLTDVVLDGLERTAPGPKTQAALTKLQALCQKAAKKGSVLRTIAVLEGGKAEALARTLVGKGGIKIEAGVSMDLVASSTQLTVALCAEPKKAKRIEAALAAIKEKSQGTRVPPRVLLVASSSSPSDDGVEICLDLARKCGLKADRIGSELTPEDAEATLLAFRSGKLQVLCVQDSLLQPDAQLQQARLHVHGVHHVICYDCPRSVEQVARLAGVTGPLAATVEGHVSILVTRSDAEVAPALVELAKKRAGEKTDAGLVKLAEAYQKVKSEIGEEAAARFVEQSREVDLKERQGVMAEFGIGAKGQAGLSPYENATGEEEMGGKGVGKGVQQVGLIGLDAIRQLAGSEHVSATRVKALSSGADIKLVPQPGDREKKKAEKEALKLARKEAATAEGGVVAPSKALLEAAFRANEKKAAKASEETKDFEGGAEYVASTKFRGARPGYVFKKGAKGLGYYRDAGGKKAALGVKAAPLKKGAAPAKNAGPRKLK